MRWWLVGRMRGGGLWGRNKRGGCIWRRDMDKWEGILVRWDLELDGIVNTR